MVILKLDEKTMKLVGAILGSIMSFVECAFLIGYAKYTLEFVRGNRLEWKETIAFAKKHFVVAIVVSVLVGLIIAGGTILLVIPGIIFAIGHTFYQEVCADNPEIGIMEIVKKSWNLTKGHKMDLFVLGLSFLGWEMLVPFTLGILTIWLTPYMLVTYLLYYEEMKKKAA